MKNMNKIKMKYYKAIEIYKDIPKAVKASFWFVICSILQKGINMITVPIFTRLLTAEEYGVYMVYLSWYEVLSIFITLNLSCGVFNNGMIKFEKDKERFTASMLGLSTLVTIISFCIYIVNIKFWNSVLGLPSIFVFTMFIQFLLVPAYLFWSARQRFEYKYLKLIFVTLFITLSNPLLGIISVLSTTYKIEARILSYVLVQVCVGLIFYIYIVKKGKTLYNKSYWRFALAFNIPLIPHYLSMSVLQQADRIMIQKMVSSSKAAIYSVAYSVSSLMLLVITSINNSFIPYTYNSLKQNNYKKIGENANKLLVFVGSTVFLVIAFGPEIIKIFAPAEYYEAIWIIPPVAVSIYFMFLYSLFCNIEFYYEENKFIMIASCIGALTNIALNYLFIPIFGYIAAGYTTLICYIIFSFAHYLCYKKVVYKNIGNIEIFNIKFIIGFSSFILIIMYLMLFIYDYTVLRYAIISILILIIIWKRVFIINQMKELKKR